MSLVHPSPHALTTHPRSAPAGAPAAPTARPTSAKFVVAGGFGVGKTTFVGAVSEVRPLRTEAPMTSAGMADDVNAPAGKTTTTVALDFGRITAGDDLVLYLFGTPGQSRFAFLWDDLLRGALGAVVLVDTARLDSCFEALDHVERHRLPAVVAVNRFDGTPHHDLTEVREALRVGSSVPVVDCDARSRDSVKTVLLRLVQTIALSRVS